MWDWHQEGEKDAFTEKFVFADISKVQDDEVGDGTTSVVVLACELLKVIIGDEFCSLVGTEHSYVNLHLYAYSCLHAHPHTYMHTRARTHTQSPKFYTFLHPTSCKIYIGSGKHALKLAGPAADVPMFVVCHRKLRALWARSCTHRQSSLAGARPWMKPGEPWCRVQRTTGERLILAGFSCSFLYHLLLNCVCCAVCNYSLCSSSSMFLSWVTSLARLSMDFVTCCAGLLLLCSSFYTGSIPVFRRQTVCGCCHFPCYLSSNILGWPDVSCNPRPPSPFCRAERKCQSQRLCPESMDVLTSLFLGGSFQ